MPTVPVGAAVVEYLVDGSGPGLVLLHGTGGDATSEFGPLVEHFARHSTLVRPNYAGSGATTDGGGLLALDDLAEQVLAAAGAAGLERFDLAGFSLGAAVAMRAAARAPERVRSLVLVNGWLSSDDARVQLQFRLWLELHARDHRLLAQHLMLTGFSAPYLSSLTWIELEAATAEMALTIPPGMARQSELDLRLELSGDARLITARTLVIGSTRDAIVPVEHTRALHGAIAGARYAELESGHLVFLEAAEALGAMIDDFVRAGRR